MLVWTALPTWCFLNVFINLDYPAPLPAALFLVLLSLEVWGVLLLLSTTPRRSSQVDPLLCPKCSGNMKVIAFIEKPDVIKKILKHLGLWHVKRKPQPLAHGPPANQLPLYDDASGPRVDDLLVDPQYPVDLLNVV